MRASVIAGLLGVLAAVGAIAVAVERSGRRKPTTPAAEVASFAAPATRSSAPSAAERQRFITAFSRGPGLVKTLDLGRIRRFSLGSAGAFSLVAAPTRKGGICYLDSASGGTCFDSLENCSGFTEGYRKVGGSKHNVITGFLPDSVVRITFASGASRASTTVRDNVFQFIVPQRLWGGIHSCTLTRADGSTRTEPITI